MNLSIITLRTHYPEFLGIRKFLQRMKVKRIKRFMLSETEIEICEQEEEKKKEIISPYLNKWQHHLQPCITEMEEMIEKAPLFAKISDEELMKIRNDILFCRLAYGFIPSEYVSFKFINKSSEERKQFCSDLDTNVFGYSVNNIVETSKILNKAYSANKYRALFNRDLVLIRSESDYSDYVRFITKHEEFVKKKIYSSMGKGVELVTIQPKQRESYFRDLIASGEWLLEERVVQRQEMACFNPSSVNTVRCMTFRTDYGVIVPYTFMRTGRNGSFVDNGGSGGIFFGIDPENGIVNSDGVDEYGESYITHPDSGIKFKGFQVPEWNNMIEICKNAALENTDMGYLSWDMAYCDNGWSVIEVNEVGQFICPQIIYQRGIKTELETYFDHMNKFV